jgi:hypothetical protein
MYGKVSQICSLPSYFTIMNEQGGSDHDLSQGKGKAIPVTGRKAHTVVRG